jgi:hypothetical protein
MDWIITIAASALISSFLFLAVWGGLKLCLAIIFKFLSKHAPKQENNMFPKEDSPAYEKRPKAWGGAIGAVSGLLSAIIIMAPITGSLNMVTSVVNMIDKADRNFFALPEARREVDNLKKYANDSVSMVLYNIGGKLIYSAAASTTINGDTFYATKEVEAFEIIVDDFITLFPAIQNGAAATEEQIKAIDELCAHMEDSELLDYVMAEFLPQMSGAWSRGEAYMMIPKPDVNSMVTPAFDAVLRICSSSDVYTVKDNTQSLLEIYSILLSSGILQTSGDLNSIIACVENSDLITKLNAVIDKNPNMATIKTYTAEIAVRAIADNIYGGAGGILGGDYADLSEKLADAIETINNKGYGTNKEKVQAMASYAEEYFADYGITIPEGVAEPVAEIMISRINSGGSISAEDIENFFKNYLSN